MEAAKTFVTRFAPSPNGWLHLGHAYSALIGARAAEAAGGQFLVRLEDIDVGRARAHFIEGIYQDLAWLGLSWPEPVMVQSARFEIYEAALKKLRDMELVYPCWATRRDIQAHWKRCMAIKRTGRVTLMGAPSIRGFIAKRQTVSAKG